MRYRKLTSDGDYTFGNGQLDFYRDVPAAVGQAVQTRLFLWLGEWFLDTDAGTPYVQGVLGKKSKAVADATLQSRVNGTQGMVNIESYESTIDADNRKILVEMDINTVYGPTSIEVANRKDY